MMRKHSGIISVVKRKLMTSEESFLTRAPMTPSDVSRRYSKGRDLDVVFRNGYRNSGMCATVTVSWRWLFSVFDTYHSRRDHGFRCERRHTGEVRERYKRGSMLQPSIGRG